VCQSSHVHLTRAVARGYVDATDEHGTKIPPTKAHIRGRVLAIILEYRPPSKTKKEGENISPKNKKACHANSNQDIL
jgi:hypothetical protein